MGQITVKGMTFHQFKSEFLCFVFVDGTATEAVSQWEAVINVSGRRPSMNTPAIYGGYFQIQADNGNILAYSVIPQGTVVRSLIVF